MFWAMALVLGDTTFLDKWRHALKPESLPKGPTRFLLAAALEHWDAHHQLMDYSSYLYWVNQAIDDEDLYENYQQIYSDITSAYALTDSNRPIAWVSAEEWVQNYHVGMALDRARAHLVAGDRNSAFSELLGLREVTGEQREEPIEISTGDGLEEIIRRRQKGFRDAPIPLGIDLFDEALEGGVEAGDLAVIAGPTNLGKSQFMCYLAVSAYKANKRVLYLTYELGREIIGERILTGLLEIPKQDLDPDTVVGDLMKKRKQWGVTDKGSIIIEDGQPTVVALQRRMEEGDFDLLLLDSADDITPRQSYPSLYLSQAEVYTDIMRDICHAMRIPTWSTAQLNREGVERARVSLKHIGDSFKKAQRAVLVVAMSQTVEEKDFYLGPLMKLHAIKETKHGAQGVWWRYLTKFGRGPRGWPGYDYYPEKGSLE